MSDNENSQSGSEDDGKLNVPNLQQFSKSDFDIKKKKKVKCFVGQYCRTLKDGQPYSYKELDSQLYDDGKKAFLRRLQKIASIQNYAINQLCGYIELDSSVKNNIILISKFDIKEIINKNIIKLDFTQKYILIYGIASAMYQIYSNGVIHRNLMPGSVYINKNSEPEVTDFGLLFSQKEDNEDPKKVLYKLLLLTDSSANEYFSPEVNLCSDLNTLITLYDAEMSDSYSFAMLVYFIYTGRSPFPDRNRIRQAISNNERPEQAEEIPPIIFSLISTCWNQDPKERLPFKTILQILSDETFISNLNGDFNNNRFGRYQRKVITDPIDISDITDELGFEFNGIKYPQVSAEKDKITLVEINETEDSEQQNVTERSVTIDASSSVPDINGLDSTPEKLPPLEIQVDYSIPILDIVSKDASNLAPPSFDLTQKIIVIYGLAAQLYKAYKENPPKTCLAPSYVYLNQSLFPLINFEKLNKDAESSHNADFVRFKPMFKKFFPEELIKNENPEKIFEDPIAQMKADVYIYGVICLSVLSATVITEDCEDLIYGDKAPGMLLTNECRDFIEPCFRPPHERPDFKMILKMIGIQKFIDSLERFDVERFVQYQKAVVEPEFIVKLNSNYDITSIPNIKMFKEKDFEREKKALGEGGSGVVYRATHRSDGVKVAYKIIKVTNDKEANRRLFTEIEILSLTDHYAVQKLYGYVKPPRTAVLTILEENGSLKNVLDKKKSDKKLDFTQKYIIFYGIVAGMYYLHSRNIIHRDLKPENILINENFEPLITDFGLSKLNKADPKSDIQSLSDVNNQLLQSISVQGTPQYMAPEIYQSKAECFFSIYDAKLSDVYAFALITYYLFSGKEPFAKDKGHQFFSSLHNRPQIPKDFPHLIKLLIEKCWETAPENRLSFEDILRIISHPVFIKNVHNTNDFDIRRFREYQKKVLIDSFEDNLSASLLGSTSSIGSTSSCGSTSSYGLTSSFGSTSSLGISTTHSKDKNDGFTINGVKFPKIPSDKVVLSEDFQISSKQEFIENPFFDIKIVENKNQKDEYYCESSLKDDYIDNADIIQNLSSQIDVLLNVNHPTFNKLHGIVNLPLIVSFNPNATSIEEIFPLSERPPAFITHYNKNGNLLTKQSFLDTTNRIIILYGIASGMYYLHKKGMAHLNLKPGNIFLNDDFEPLINIDITSRSKSIKTNLFYVLPILSFPYVAPELLDFQNKDHYEIKEKYADVYSFAMIAYYLFTGMHPFDSSRGFQPIYLRVMKGFRPMIKGIIPAPIDKLIEDCWSTNPDKRLSFKEILNRMSSSNFLSKIGNLDIAQFQAYQKNVAPDASFINKVQLFGVRTRDEFDNEKIIGNGIFGSVTLATDKTNKNQVVLKEVPSGHQNLIESQKNILSKVNFPSILPLYGIIEPTEEKKESYIIYPYAASNLQAILNLEENSTPPPEWNYTKKCIVMYGIAMGMFKLHSQDIAHQDLKPTNILLNDAWEPFITDIGLTQFVDSNQSMFQSLSIGTFQYASPESLEGDDNYDKKASDVFSFAMLVYYLMTGIQPFANSKSYYETLSKISKGERPNIPSIINDKMKELIIQCWASSPEDRPTFQKIVEECSFSDFYTSKQFRFKEQMFYDYQVKLGEMEYIKFDEKKIRNFKGSSIRRVSNMNSSLSPIKILEDMAKTGHAESQYRLGCIYRDKENYDSAFEYFKLAAEQDYLDAIIAYALCLKEGHGVEENREEAMKQINKAIEMKSVDAMIILATWYSTDRPRQYGLSFNLLKKAKELKHPDAAALLGSMIEKRKLNINYSTDEVREFYNTSCILGSYEGMYHMATFYHQGVGIETDLNEAARLYHLASNNPTNSPNKQAAIFSLSHVYEEMGKHETAFRWADYYRQLGMFVGYVRCADLLERGVGIYRDAEKANQYMETAKEKRFISDQIKLSLLYKRGKGIKRDLEKYLFWAKVAAENGSSSAQANLADYYIKDEPDLDKAEEWGKKSYDAGCKRGKWNLSRVYKKKKEVEKQINILKELVESGYERAFTELALALTNLNRNKEAADYFKKAADRKLPIGQFHYGLMLLEGKFVEKNLKKGLEMITESAEQGNKEATKKLVHIYTNGEYGIKADRQLAEKYKALLGSKKS